MEYIRLFNESKNEIGRLANKNDRLVVDLKQSHEEYGDEFKMFFIDFMSEKEHYIRNNIKIGDKIVEGYQTAETSEELFKVLANKISKHRFSFGRVFAIINSEGRNQYGF